MSLFDVIKYPISNPPTLEELKTLPNEIFAKWIDESGAWLSMDRATVGIDAYKSEVANWYGRYGETDAVEELDLLRKIIKEYDEPF